MNWKDRCFAAMDEAKMFENSGHRTRFKELLSCYASYPFFTKGLCKCMYLSAWDEEHFCIMLEMMADLSLGKEKDTKEMRAKGESLADEQRDAEYYVYQLSNAFLDGASYEIPEDAQIGEEFTYILKRAMEAAKVIDSID